MFIYESSGGFVYFTKVVLDENSSEFRGGNYSRITNHAELLRHRANGGQNQRFSG